MAMPVMLSGCHLLFRSRKTRSIDASQRCQEKIGHSFSLIEQDVDQDGDDDEKNSISKLYFLIMFEYLSSGVNEADECEREKDSVLDKMRIR